MGHETMAPQGEVQMLVPEGVRQIRQLRELGCRRTSVTDTPAAGKRRSRACARCSTTSSARHPCRDRSSRSN
jgi:hypothetical protein